MRFPARVELRLGGRTLGVFNRGQLVELHATIGCILEVEWDLAKAWLGLEAAQREKINRIVGVVADYFEKACALGCGNAARERRIACGLILELLPDIPAAAVAAVVRVRVQAVESNARWLKALERQSPMAGQEITWLREAVRKALES